MKRFTYFASVVGREIECSNVNEVTDKPLSSVAD
jgi:hypothetical protein